MKVSQNNLNQWRTMTDRLRRLANGSKVAINNGDRQRAQELNVTILTTLLEMSVGMDQAGAQRTDNLPMRREIQTHKLATPANKRLLAALEEAAAAWQEVDLERGYQNDGPAQIIVQMHRHVAREIETMSAVVDEEEENATSEGSLSTA